jgi:hypothetical protein
MHDNGILGASADAHRAIGERVAPAGFRAADYFEIEIVHIGCKIDFGDKESGRKRGRRDRKRLK